MTDDIDIDQSISKAHLEASGWSMASFAESNPFESHFIYIHDFRTGMLQLYSISRDAFSRSEKAYIIEDAARGIAHLAKRHHRGPLTPKQSNNFAGLLCGYTKATRSYQQWLGKVGADARLHLVLNIYSENQALVRPFIMNPAGPVLPAETVLESSRQVRERDLDEHPEWFV